MTKLGKIAVVAVLAAFASAAQAEDGGWNTKYGLLFGLQNVFQNGNSSVVDSYNGAGTGVGVGAQMNLSAQNAVRVYANLSRTSNPGYEQTTNGVVTNVLPATTSVYHAKVGAAYMLRLTTASISPYAGAGASLSFDRSARNGDEGSVVNPTKYDNTDRTLGAGVDGTLGVEWRVHKSVALFAEYVAAVTLYSQRSVDNKTTGAALSSSSYSQTRFLNFGTGIGQGGQLGVVAFF